MFIKDLITNNPYSISKKDNNYFEKKILKLTKFHLKNNIKYSRFIGFFKKKINNLENLKPLPVNIFKSESLKTGKNKNFIELNSSGTSGNVSKIFLDEDNAYTQKKVLNNIMNFTLGKDRFPMLIIEKKPDYQNIKSISASLAAIHGFSMFGKSHSFALNSNGELDEKIVNDFIKNYKNQKKLVFGFTFNIFKYLLNNKKKFNFENSILVHGGGWKKLENIKIDNKKFINISKLNLKFSRVINYYGLVEQTGSIFLECEKCNRFVTTIYSDLNILNQKFEKLKFGEDGLIQLISLLPTSYPGHNILTEDIGCIDGEDNCKCGKKGKYFYVKGRIKNSEVRGCSDTKI